MKSNIHSVIGRMHIKSTFTQGWKSWNRRNQNKIGRVYAKLGQYSALRAMNQNRFATLEAKYA